MNSHLQYQIALTLLPDIGAITAKKLVAYCGGVEAIFKESSRSLGKIPGISNRVINSIKNHQEMKLAEREVEFIIKNNIQAIFFLEDNYPNRLKHCADSPLLLYFKGNVNFNAQQVLSVVGTRQASEYGLEICENILSEFSGSDTLIVSGLAYGIDTCSHRAALKYHLPTVGVLGHGLDRIYPQQNKKYADQMQENGGILTEFRQGTIPDRVNFPQRNRIVAGMADATLVVESKKRGGSLITAHLAFDYNRDVLAIPGRPADINSIGCNYLIQKNIAQLINSADDIKKLLNWEKETVIGTTQKQLFVDLNDNERIILDNMEINKNNAIDTISIESGLSMSKTAAILLSLEFKGLVKTLPGKQYKLI